MKLIWPVFLFRVLFGITLYTDNRHRQNDSYEKPISILPTLSKACENLLKDQIVQYLTFKKLITPFQSGFREHHSTSSTVIKVCQDINKDSNMATILVLIDFTKAFDLIDHNIFVAKLEKQYNFSAEACNLFKSYLGGRHQLVEINGSRSQFRQNERGVPQGSVGGPLAFTMSINDLPRHVRYCSIQSFADDTQVYLSCPISELPHYISLLNADLLSILNFCRNNGLVLNASKTKAIIFTRPNSDLPVLPPITIDNDIIEIVDKVNNLGIVMNKHLTWNDHVSFIIRKVYTTLRILNQHRNTLSIDTKTKLVKTLLLPHFIYGNVIFSHLSVETERHLKVCFNSCIRFIYNLRRYDHVSQYQSSILGIPLQKYFHLQLLVFLFKLIKFKEPTYLYEELSFSRSQRTHNILIPTHHTNYLGNSFVVRGARLWNALPHRLKNLTSISDFKQQCREYLRNT